MVKYNYKSSKKYYYCLAKAGSFWGKKMLDIFDIYKGNNNINLVKEINQVNSIRKKFNNYKEKKENPKIYDISTFIFIKKWVLIETIIPYLSIPIITAVFYLPLYLLNIQSNQGTTAISSAEKFIITDEFIDQVLQQKDTTPPAVPQGFSIVQ